MEEIDIDINECYVCLENGKYELTETRFQLNNEDLLLLTAYNRFSTLENVSGNFADFMAGRAISLAGR